MKLKCKHCDYAWEYLGHSTFYATCPRCRYQVNLRNKDGKTAGKNNTVKRSRA